MSVTDSAIKICIEHPVGKRKEPPKIIRVHKRLSSANFLDLVSLNFEIVSKECFTSATHQFV